MPVPLASAGRPPRRRQVQTSLPRYRTHRLLSLSSDYSPSQVNTPADHNLITSVGRVGGITQIGASLAPNTRSSLGSACADEGGHRAAPAVAGDGAEPAGRRAAPAVGDGARHPRAGRLLPGRDWRRDRRIPSFRVQKPLLISRSHGYG